MEHSDALQIPKPADVLNRRVPLPWQRPEPLEEDQQAPARLQAILENPNYRRADTDVDFLAQDSMRGVRLQIDYFKPEMLLEEHGIRYTIVVFGSTRICEPARGTTQSGGVERGTNGGCWQEQPEGSVGNCRTHPCEEPILRSRPGIGSPRERDKPNCQWTRGRRRDWRRTRAHGGG